MQALRKYSRGLSVAIAGTLGAFRPFLKEYSVPFPLALIATDLMS